MDNLWPEISRRLIEGNALSLAIVGMGVVFIGLLSLLIVMLILKKVLHPKEEVETTETNEPAPAAAVNDEAGTNMEEVAAAIALAFNLHILRCSPKNITIKRLSHSLWKESLRAKAIERL